MAVSTNLIQIEEFEMAAGLTDIYYTTTGGLDNSLIGIYNDHYGVYPVNVEITGSGVNQGLHITYEAQTFAMNVAVLFIKGDLNINNTLTSNSETEALSAKQGKILKDLIDAIQITGNLSDLDDVELTSLTGGDILVYDGISQKWINTAQPSIPSDLNDLDDVTITSPSNGQVLTYHDGEWINANSSAGGVDYSTTEQDTGLKWVDGKKVYQKTISFNTLTPGANNKIDNSITISNFKIIDFSGTVFLTDGVNELAIPYVTSNQQLSAFFSDGVYIFVSSTLNVGSGYLTIKYTKNNE